MRDITIALLAYLCLLRCIRFDWKADLAPQAEKTPRGVAILDGGWQDRFASADTAPALSADLA